MKIEDLISVIITKQDETRLGGYPSQWVVENEKVYWATVDHDGGPSLEVMPVDQFIDKYGDDVDPRNIYLSEWCDAKGLNTETLSLADRVKFLEDEINLAERERKI